MMHQHITFVNLQPDNAGVNSHMSIRHGEPRQIIRTMLKSRGFRSQRALAIAAGVSQPTLSRYLAGDTDDMELQSWRALAGALDLTISQLLGESPILRDPAVDAVVRAMERMPEQHRAAIVAAANALASK